MFLAYLRNTREAFNVEESILRYLSLSSEEQSKLHDNQLAALEAGLRQCAIIKEQPVTFFDESRTNPRAVKGASPIFIRNATLIDGDGSIRWGYSILLREGIISKIGQDIDSPKDAKIVDAGGRYVSPGLVDMVLNTYEFADIQHSHAGVDSLPELFGVDDTNEISGDITPYVRTIDAINPSDEMFYRISSGGVATSLILPGFVFITMMYSDKT